MKFTNTDIKAIQFDSDNWMGIMFSLKKIRELLKANKKHAKIIWNDFECVGHPSKFGMDTAVRDIWFDLVARHYVRRDWPKGSEKKNKSITFLQKSLQSFG